VLTLVPLGFLSFGVTREEVGGFSSLDDLAHVLDPRSPSSTESERRSSCFRAERAASVQGCESSSASCA
jgi:hypothetical protein